MLGVMDTELSLVVTTRVVLRSQSKCVWLLVRRCAVARFGIRKALSRCEVVVSGAQRSHPDPHMRLIDLVFLRVFIMGVVALVPQTREARLLRTEPM